MPRIAWLLLAVGCSADPAFLALPSTTSAETWLASRPDGKPWSLSRVSSSSTPIRVSADTEVLLLEYWSPTGLRENVAPTREDFGTAECDVIVPDSAWAFRSAPELSWERQELLPDSLDRVLRGIAGPNCHRCVAFESRSVLLAPPGGQRLGEVRALVKVPSGAAVALRPIEAPVRVERSDVVTPLTGCPANIETLDGPSEGGRYWAANLSQLFELSISEDETRCQEERRFDFPTPWRQVQLLRAAGPEDEVEVFILGVSTSTTWKVLRFDGETFEPALELPRRQGDHKDILRIGAGDLLFTNEHVLVRWTEGQLVELPASGLAAITGLSSVDGLGTFVLGTLDLAVVALELDLAANTFGPPIVLAELADRVQTLAPFRGGFVALHRGGQTIEFHRDLGLCPTAVELGDNNHISAFAIYFPDGTWVADSNGEQRGPTLTWFEPQPPESPSSAEF